MTLVPFRQAVVSPRQPVRSDNLLAKRKRALTGGLAPTLGTLLFVGCASYQPHPLVPDKELAGLRAIGLGNLRIEYTESGAPSEGAPVQFDPRDGLNEAELASVALTINPTLRAKRAEIGEAQALLVSAGLLPNPDIGAFIRSGIGGASGTALGFDALFGLLRPDERPAKRALAEAQIEVVRAEVAAEELRLVSDVRRARIALLSAGQSARLFQQELALRDNAVALVHQQRELGETTQIGLALVELDRTMVQRQVREATAAVEHGRRFLNALLGVPPTLDLQLVGSGGDLTFSLVPDLTDEQIDARLLVGRSDLRTRVAEYQRAEQDLRLAVAQQYPNLSLGPTYEKDIEGSQGLGLGASIEVPLFDRNQGGIAEKVATRERKGAEYIATLHNLRAQAFEARAQLRRARAEVELEQSEVLPLVQRTDVLFEAAFRAKELSIFEWLTVRARAVQARRDLLDALTRYASAVVELDSATGAPLVTVLTETSSNESKP